MVLKDAKMHIFINGKAKAHFRNKMNPRRLAWTVYSRRLHKKGIQEDVKRKTSRKSTKVQRAIVGASLEGTFPAG